ncbi:hypothetical protein ACFIJ5_11955 [Haloimpatiens sp. FM7330]|uniref:hypothetical protein n=1 Tax=Haloimpatiens sp. FM7330 TaxID=3298610 RepID=UPI00363290E0
MEISSVGFKRCSLKKSDKINFLIIMMLGILVRVFFIFNISCEPISDFSKYQTIATNIFMGRGHYYLGKPIAFQPMGYPCILGCFYKLIGSNSIFLGKVLNVFLSSMTLVMILFILLKLCNSKFTVYLSYILITFIPNYIAYNNVLGSEILITFLLTVIIYLQLSSFNYKIRYSIIGIFIGIAALTKPFFLVYPILVSIILWLKNKNIKYAAKLFCISSIFMCLVVAPWTYRNYKKFNSLIPVSYNGGYVLFINNNSNNKNGAWMPVADIDVCEDLKNKFLKCNFKYRDSSKNEINQIMINPTINKIFKSESKKWILNHPLRFCKLGIIRLHNTFFSGAGDIYEWAMNSKKINTYSKFLKRNFIHSIFDKYIYILSFFGIIYVIYNLKNIMVSLFKKELKIKYIISIPFFNIAYFVLIYFIFEGQPRYNFPMLFLFSICTVICLRKIYIDISKINLFRSDFFKTKKVKIQK